MLELSTWHDCEENIMYTLVTLFHYYSKKTNVFFPSSPPTLHLTHTQNKFLITRIWSTSKYNILCLYLNNFSLYVLMTDSIHMYCTALQN